jgi:hypothetical protein
MQIILVRTHSNIIHPHRWMTGLLMKRKDSDFCQQVNEISTKRKKKFGKSSETVKGCCCVISIKDFSVAKIMEKMMMIMMITHK